ncbi:MAG: hypothetical protein ACFFAN_02555 [Promethearchaeota archaeon]
MTIIPRRKQKVKYSRKFACKHLEPFGDISNSLQPLCYCPSRELVLGTKAYVCQVCSIYDESNVKISDVYEKSKKIAEKKIEDIIEDIEKEEEIDLSTEEFEEEEEEIELTLKFEKRKAGKGELGEEEEFAEVECPFCGELYDDLASHIRNCEFAPDDASIEDIMPSRSKKKRKRKTTREKTSKGVEEKKTEEKMSQSKKKCPYCGKEFARLGRHINSCSKKPEHNKEKKE